MAPMFDERMRWRHKESNSVASWARDRSVWLRRGARAMPVRIGTARSIRGVRRMLRKQLPGQWDRAGNYGEEFSTAIRRLPPEPAVLPGLVEFLGVMMDRGERVDPGLRLGRIALYALRTKELEARQDNPRESLFDRPLTIEEIRRAIMHPESGLSDSERRAALAALFDNP